MYEVDARGYACPEPAMMAMEAMKNHRRDTIKIRVSSVNAKNNIEKLVKKNKKRCSVQALGKDYEIIIEA